MSALRSFRRSLIPSTAIAVILLAGFAHQASAATRSANPAVSVQASPSGFPAGVWIYGTAMLGQGSAPTGSLAFTLYGPFDPTCAMPLLVSQVPVSGNGYYASGYFPTTLAGTYRWTVRYLGDANNNPTAATACSDPGAVVMVAKRNPTLRSTATTSGGTVTNAATLGSGSGPNGPTGTVTFALYGAGNMTCAGSPIFTSSKQVAGNGTYTADSFRPAASGTYQWTVLYSGDANNNAAMTWCTDPANAVTVTLGGTVGGTTVTATPTAVRPYEQLTVRWSNIATATSGDWFALYAAGAADGSVVLWRYTGGSANGSVNVTVPWGTKPGSYEVRLFANNSVQRLDVSEVITVW